MKSAPKHNLAHLFFRAYYQQIKDPEALGAEEIQAYEKVLAKLNHQLFRASMPDKQALPWPAGHDLAPPFFQTTLFTSYPGLFSGSGISHETGALGEIKLGFQFDYASGLPVIAGSTVKGVLSHVAGQLEKAAKEHPGEVAQYLRPVKGMPVLNPEETQAFLQDFHAATFRAPEQPYQRDVFLDAFPAETRNANGVFLGPDFITPHGSDPLRNPVPVQFMKILPGVGIRFTFRLHPWAWQGHYVSAEAKLGLFQKWLLDWGLGAKQRSGYGRLTLAPKDWELVTKPQLVADSQPSPRQGEPQRPQQGGSNPRNQGRHGNKSRGNKKRS